MILSEHVTIKRELAERIRKLIDKCDDEQAIDELFKALYPPVTLQLKEGCWYERRDGKVVGPMIKDKHEDYPFSVKEMGSWSKTGKRWMHRDDELDLIREVPAPVPKYRPFKDDEAYEHCGKVLKGKNFGWNRALVICLNDDDTIVIGDESVNYKYAFDWYTFLDDSPFGVKVDE